MENIFITSETTEEEIGRGEEKGTSGTAATGGQVAGSTAGLADVTQKVLSEEEKQEKLLIVRNIIIISLAFTFLFTSYNAVANLQASINK